MEELLNNLAIQFRNAIEAAKSAGESHDYIREFPKGQCGNISDIFSQYLIDLDIEPVFYVNGTYYGDNEDERWSHTWLEVDGIIIDLTADQFKLNNKPLQNNTPVYVGLINDWYRLFDTEYGSYHEHNGLETSWINYDDLNDCYKIIKKYMRIFREENLFLYEQQSVCR